jgi:hypothetical protein
MDDKQLTEIEARVSAATPGPWTTYDDDSEADAEFIAHAREDIPALLAEVKQLREQVRVVRLVGEDYNAAIEQLHLVYGPDAEPFISVIETVRDEEIFHEGPHQEFTDGCVGCLTWRIADALTRAVNGGEAL